MNLHHLLLFHVVAESGSITSAAEKLGLSQPAISQQLHALESSIGASLFYRVPRGMELTEAGSILYSYSRRMVQIEMQAEQALADFCGLRRGTLSLGSSLTLGSYLLPDLFAEYRRAYPDIELTVEIANTENISKWVADGILEAGFVEGLPPEAGLEAVQFAEDRLVPIASPDHPVCHERRITPEILCRYPFVVREAGSGTRAVAEQEWKRLGLWPQVSLTLGSSEAIKRAVMAGAGVAVVSRLALGSETATGGLRMLDVKGLQIRRPLYRIIRRGYAPSPAAEAFFTLLQRRFSGS